MNYLRTLGTFAFFLALSAFIIFVGWDEPLRYRTLSRVDITAEENALRPPGPTPRPGLQSHLTGSALDRAPWSTDKQGRVQYSHDFDTRTLGTRTEASGRANTFKSGDSR